MALNIAEGSTAQTDQEQARFLGLAIRSLLETVACQHLINRRGWLKDSESLHEVYKRAEILVAKLHTLRKTIAPRQNWLRESGAEYSASSENSVESE